MPTASSNPLLDSTPQISTMDARDLSLLKPVVDDVKEAKGALDSTSSLDCR